MRINRLLLLLVFALPFLFVPVPAHAGVYIGVSIAPPVLPVYAQPMCPEPGWMWMPGYWAYDYDSGGYYWVPGTWVPAPYEGALWTPGYWGWETGLYYWHTGYWGRHIGYYGGVNYGFGYFGIGFLGGYWRDRDFFYNRAYMRIGEGYRNAYEDRRDFDRHIVQRDSRIGYSGGPGGINHRPMAEERLAERDQHTQPTSFQTQHIDAARQDRSSYFNSNNGRPGNGAVARPLAPSRPSNPAPGNNNMRVNPSPVNRGETNRSEIARPGYQPGNQQPQSQPSRPQYNNPSPGNGQMPQRSQPTYNPTPGNGPSQQRTQPSYNPAPGNGQMPQRSQPEYRQAPQVTPSRPQSSPSPSPRVEQRSQPQPQPQMRQSAPSAPSRSQPSGGGGQMQQRSQPSSGSGGQQRGGGGNPGPRGR